MQIKLKWKLFSMFTNPKNQNHYTLTETIRRFSGAARQIETCKTVLT